MPSLGFCVIRRSQVQWYCTMKVNVVGKKLSVADRAYSAGFLDADGAIMATIEHHKEKKFRFRVRVTLKITQRERKILDWFLTSFGVGYIRKNRTTFDWIMRDQQIVYLVLKRMIPYLKVKRKQADIAQDILTANIKTKDDLIAVARLADALSRFNVRSQNRRKNFAAMIQDSFSSND